jgi:hypothetical protein
VPQHEVGVVGGLLEVGEGLLDERVGALLDRVDADQPRLAEQGRARERDELPRQVLVGGELADLERGILRTEEVPQGADGAVREKP